MFDSWKKWVRHFTKLTFLFFPKIYFLIYFTYYFQKSLSDAFLSFQKHFCVYCVFFFKNVFRSRSIRLFPENSLKSFDKRGDGEQKSPREGFQLQGGFTALSFHFYRGGQSPYIFFQSGFSRTLRFKNPFLRGEGAVFYNRLLIIGKIL